MRIALATCAPLPEPDPDEALLVAALRDRGIAVEVAPWDGPAAWRGFDQVVLRSTWDYAHRPTAFLSWIDTVAHETRLRNPASVVRWNIDKHYLMDLDVPTVPTEIATADADLAALWERCGWDEVVIKPRMSASSFGTRAFSRGELGQAQAHVARLDRPVLVQPYLRSVEDHGERALVWIAGELTHAVRKERRFEGEDERVSRAVAIASDERALAEAVLAPLADDLLYARVDIARGPDAAPLIMELELIEPSLFLEQHPPALDRLADAIAAG